MTEGNYCKQCEFQLYNCNLVTLIRIIYQYENKNNTKFMKNLHEKIIVDFTIIINCY